VPSPKISTPSRRGSSGSRTSCPACAWRSRFRCRASRRRRADRRAISSFSSCSDMRGGSEGELGGDGQHHDDRARNGSSLVMRQNRSERDALASGEAPSAPPSDSDASQVRKRPRPAWSASRASAGSPSPSAAGSRRTRSGSAPGARPDQRRVHDDLHHLGFHDLEGLVHLRRPGVGAVW
jgi:hypothetical protein